MMEIAIYLVGVIAGYISIKYSYLNGSGFTWGVQDRAIAIVLSITSWCAVLTGLIVFLIDSFDSNKPAKW